MSRPPSRALELFPATPPYRSGRLQVSDLHNLHFEEYGTPRGKPVVFLHGGPGGGIRPDYARYFHPKKWRVILFDQRGCGRSRPHAELRENTTWDLVEDIEKLRGHLEIERWCVFGGSWGSTLALAYAEKHPQRCTSLILRGIFLLRQSELHWFYQEGASHLFPEEWEKYLEPIPVRERGNLIAAYYKRLVSRDAATRRKAAKAWTLWEAATSKLVVDEEFLKSYRRARFADAFARIEAHYFINGGFLGRDDQLVRDARKIRHIPGVIVQGRYDVVCPMRSAWDLSRAWPAAELVVVPDAGHSMTEVGIRSALIDATERFAGLSDKPSRSVAQGGRR